MAKSGPVDTLVIALPILVALMVIILAKVNDKDLQPDVASNDEITADWNQAGECVAENDVGICCGIWDKYEGAIVETACNKLIEEKAPAQALVSYGGDTYEGVAAISLAVSVENIGTETKTLQVGKITVTSADGDQRSIDEIKAKVNTLIGSKLQVAPEKSVNFGMVFDDSIRLDVPTSVQSFTIADGTYRIVININEVTDTTSELYSQRIIELTALGGEIVFNIEVSK